MFYRKRYSDDKYESDWQLAYRDHYPYINGYDYRYQMVQFNDNHAISSWRISEWVSPGVQAGGE